ncbi:MAG: YecA family protein [Pseudonocardiaceae bacterium]
MTLVIGMMNRSFAAQVSDRRISDRYGVPIDEESNKAVLLTCKDGRFVVGYTGLATFNRFQTKNWIVRALFDAGPPDYTSEGMPQRLIRRASHDLVNLPALRGLPAENRALTVMWTGFLTRPQQPAVSLLMSNFQDFDKDKSHNGVRDTFCFVKFFTERQGVGNNMTWVQRIGQWETFEDENENALRSRLLERRPAEECVNSAVQIIRDIAAAHPQAGVGSRISSIVLPADHAEPPVMGYHTSIRSEAAYMPSGVVALGPRDHRIEPERRLAVLPPAVKNKVGRNAPCPCGSHQKYKRCHGQQSPGTAAA